MTLEIITFTHIQREKGKVTRKSKKDTRVRNKEQTPGPSDSSER